eukprot:1852975-Pyramimonas_sp.AAC.1
MSGPGMLGPGMLGKRGHPYPGGGRVCRASGGVHTQAGAGYVRAGYVGAGYVRAGFVGAGYVGAGYVWQARVSIPRRGPERHRSV